MNQLVEYTTKNLYGEFKPEELCYIVEPDYNCINEISYTTDNLSQALAEAKETNSKIFIFEKKFAEDCLNTHRIFEDMLENLEEEGLDIGYFIAGDEENAEKEFTKLVEKWFKKYVGNMYWFPDRLLGTLKVE